MIVNELHQHHQMYLLLDVYYLRLKQVDYHTVNIMDVLIVSEHLTSTHIINNVVVCICGVSNIAWFAAEITGPNQLRPLSATDNLGIDDEYAALIRSCWNVDPQSRPSAAILVQQLTRMAIEASGEQQ